MKKRKLESGIESGLCLLGDTFCSGVRNDHKPHILRGVTLIIISLVAVFLMGMSFARYYFLHETVLGQQVVASVLIDLTNQTRIAYGESPLVRNDKLESAASMKATDMATHQYFAHNSPTGATPWTWIKEAGYDFLYAGENLAIDFTQSKDVSDAWLKSPTHKANLLNSKFREIGISTREGVFNGHNTIYVVQMFGTPKDTKSTQDIQVTLPSDIFSNEDSVPNTVPLATIESPDGEVAGATTEKEEDEGESAQNEVADTYTSTSSEVNVVDEESKEEYVTLFEENGMMIVADREAIENEEDPEAALTDSRSNEYVTYSNFWQKLIYNFWFNLNYIYKGIVAIIMLAIAVLFFTEFRKHHWTHISYGLLTIGLLLLLLYINKSLW